ncbi:uncharacterized protein LOC112489657 [Ziziphus jujuba]|uniref:Uncharacterized protein LOC112489657 n=1 Tax=Ziziphus jujuba TaxID=326968 RepID=A0A6P6FR75_ZIZJJ|nr:uncharacterized protein LOC112489657 [Ziziphus jujuba]
MDLNFYVLNFGEVNQRKMEIQHPGHEHPLVLFKGSDIFIEGVCHICSDDILDAIHYACLECNYYLHFPCAVPFLREIEHPFHPHDYLRLISSDVKRFGLRCRICNTKFDSSFFYVCHGCKSVVCIYCVLRTPTATCENKDKGWDQPFCHKQPMEVLGVKKYDVDEAMIKCYLCELSLSSSTSQAYSCKICKYFFHKSCLELPSKLRHPFHLKHSLILKVVGANADNTRCHLCDKTCVNFIFACPLCHFYVCVRCLSSRPTIMYQGHNHLLYLVDKLAYKDDTIRCCSASYTYCQPLVSAPNELVHTERYLFFCENCNFSVHLLCGPLPCVIKHNCHLHPLILFESIVEDYSGENYCDACETERDPRICVYYCEQCKYIAHVHCVLSEVVRALQGDCRDVDLRIVKQMKLVTKTDHHDDTMLENERRNIEESKEKEKQKPILLSIILSAEKDLGVDANLEFRIDEEEENEVNNEIEGISESEKYRRGLCIMYLLIEKNRYIVDQKSNLAKGEDDEDQQIEKRIQEFSSDKSFEELLNKLNNFDYPTRWSKVTLKELRLELVNVGYYKIPWNLAHVLKHLLAKYGDISGDDQKTSKLKPDTKSLIYFLLCRLLHGMSRIMLVDVTENLLGDWYSCLRLLKSKGFKVEFINSALEQLVHAYIGFRTNRDAIKTKINQKILDLEHNIAKLEAKLKKYKEYRDICDRHAIFSCRDGGSKKTNYSMEEEYLNGASKMKWKIVADYLGLS